MCFFPLEINLLVPAECDFTRRVLACELFFRAKAPTNWGWHTFPITYLREILRATCLDWLKLSPEPFTRQHRPWDYLTVRRYFQHAQFIPIVGVGKRGAY